MNIRPKAGQTLQIIQAYYSYVSQLQFIDENGASYRIDMICFNCNQRKQIDILRLCFDRLISK